MDTGTRILAYKMLLEKFNEKYGTLIPAQKTVLKEYINNVSNTVKLKEFVNSQFTAINKSLTELIPTVADKTTQIKLTEVLNLLQPLDKNQSVKDENIISLLQYHQLIAEIKAIK
jgi:mevalonate kinase